MNRLWALILLPFLLFGCAAPTPASDSTDAAVTRQTTSPNFEPSILASTHDEGKGNITYVGSVDSKGDSSYDEQYHIFHVEYEDMECMFAVSDYDDTAPSLSCPTIVTTNVITTTE